MRVLRSVAGRRALQLVLLVGGLFVLGFVCGEQAHAADGTPVRGTATAVHETVTSAGSGVAGRDDQARAVRTGGGEQIVTPRAVGEKAVTRTVTGTTVSKAVTSVRDVVSAVTAVSGSVAEKPTMRPTVLSLPLPDVRQVVEVPVQVPPGAKTPAPGPRRSGGPVVPARPAASAPPLQRHLNAGARTAGAAPVPLAVYGPEFAFAPQNSAHSSARHGTAAGAPGRPAPTGDPDGVLGKQAVDGSASRHGDAHAVTFGNRTPLRLLPGAAPYADAPRTRERHRDIPVFPG